MLNKIYCFPNWCLGTVTRVPDKEEKMTPPRQARACVPTRLSVLLLPMVRTLFQWDGYGYGCRATVIFLLSGDRPLVPCSFSRAVLDPRIGCFMDNLPPFTSVVTRSQQTITSQPGPLRYVILPTCSWSSSSSLTRSNTLRCVFLHAWR